MKPSTVTYLAHGMCLVGRSTSGGVYIVTQLATRSWALLEISAADLLLSQRCETMPHLHSARCEVIADTRRRCVQEFQERQRVTYPILDEEKVQ